MSAVMFFNDLPNGTSVAIWQNRRIGMIMPYNSCGPLRFAWSFNCDPLRVALRFEKDKETARAELTRCWLEWLKLTTEKEMAETVRSVA